MSLLGKDEVFHTWIWGLSAILPHRSSPALSGCTVNVGGQPFSGQGLRVVPKPHLCYFGCVLGAIVCWNVKLQPNLRSWALWTTFSSRVSLYFAMFASLARQPDLRRVLDPGFFHLRIMKVTVLSEKCSRNYFCNLAQIYVLPQFCLWYKILLCQKACKKNIP